MAECRTRPCMQCQFGWHLNVPLTAVKDFLNDLRPDWKQTLLASLGIVSEDGAEEAVEEEEEGQTGRMRFWWDQDCMLGCQTAVALSLYCNGLFYAAVFKQCPIDPAPLKPGSLFKRCPIKDYRSNSLAYVNHWLVSRAL